MQRSLLPGQGKPSCSPLSAPPPYQRPPGVPILPQIPSPCAPAPMMVEPRIGPPPRYDHPHRQPPFGRPNGHMPRHAPSDRPVKRLNRSRRRRGGAATAPRQAERSSPVSTAQCGSTPVAVVDAFALLRQRVSWPGYPRVVALHARMPAGSSTPIHVSVAKGSLSPSVP